ncbi:kinase-like domain-containing protein [Glomus cerebriforme]|uniref:Kinase-like domain-containing protein n=1 Tax=Glomus cerebriforme TaxID=658196 RepID=A0A397SMF3_9GLOM|nr:kinase-like domain-containing protein [Glomus cerebriforme]
MHKIRNIFHKIEAESKVQKEAPYPWSLEKHYKISKNVLGTGSFGVVKECTDKRTGINYALKIINKTAIQGKEQMLTTELDVLKKVDHPHVVTLHELFETNKAVYIITDLASGGELFYQLLQKGSYTERDAANLVQQVLKGVGYLHDNEIVHRDLKPENLLFSNKTDNPNLMITDFGLSKILRHHNDILMTACGTPGYVAPEVLRQTGHGKPVDIWSVGVIMYTLLCGYTPFWGEDQASLFDNILSGAYYFEDEYWSNISDYAKDLIDKMLTYDADKRITAHEALQHPWFHMAHMADNFDLLNNVRTNFPARTTLKKAINVVQGITRLRRGSVRSREYNTNVNYGLTGIVKHNNVDISDISTLDLQITSMSRNDTFNSNKVLKPTTPSLPTLSSDDSIVIEKDWYSSNKIIPV